MLTWPPAGRAVFAAEAGHAWSAGVPGLEPRLTGPEPVGLPITPYPIGVGLRARSAPVKSSRRRPGGQSVMRASGAPLAGPPPARLCGADATAAGVPATARAAALRAITTGRVAAGIIAAGGDNARPGQAGERPVPAE